jgi:transposase-like protein
MGVKNPRQYTTEFKRQAVQLARELKSGPKAAHQLGIPESNIHTWGNQEKAGTLGGGISGKQTIKEATQVSSDEELKQLRRENTELKKVNHIWKQAAAFFSQDHLK